MTRIELAPGGTVTEVAPPITDHPARVPTARALLRPVAIYAASRLLVAATIALSVVRDGLPTPLRALANWDGAWYLALAAFGYPAELVRVSGRVVQSGIAFFPLYPMLVRGFSLLTGLSVLPSAVVVANVFGVAATVLLWLLARRVADEGVADRTVALFSFFPVSVVLSMAYSESVMLTWALACLLALMDRRWLVAGVTGALATASRPNAIAVVGACGWVALRELIVERNWRALVAPVLASSGIVGYFGWLWWRTGVPNAWLLVQRHGWFERIDFGQNTWRRVLRVLSIVEPSPTNTHILSFLALLFALGCVVLLWRWRAPGLLNVYTAGVLALAVLSYQLGPRPRFVWTAVPLFMALAYFLKGRPFEVVMGALAALLVAATIVYALTPGGPFISIP